jgi:hypothetical protein
MLYRKGGKPGRFADKGDFGQFWRFAVSVIGDESSQ